MPGKINVNLITDPRVLLALTDPQSGNFFAHDAASTPPVYDVYNPADYADPTKVFGRLMAARANLPAASASFTLNAYDPVTNTVVKVQIPGPNDAPIRSFGTATTGTFVSSDYPIPVLNSQGVAATPARTVTDPTTGTEVGVFSLPNQTHPYLRQELLRKIQNNLTTTSDTFAVYITVGFFEVTNPGPYTVNTRPLLGKELFKDMPGDLRQKYYAVIDRSNLSLDPTNLRVQGGKSFITELTPTDPLVPTAPVTPIQTTLNLRVQNGSPTVLTAAQGGFLSLSYKGTPFTIATGQFLRIGTGATAEWVLVTQAGGYSSATGIGSVVVTRNVSPSAAIPALPVTPAHGIGDSVTNVIPGNPGPQPGFNPNLPNYQPVVPYFGRIE